MKNKIIISLILIIFLFSFNANIVYAAEKTKCEGKCEITNICACELPVAIKLIYEWVVRLGIALAFLMIMYGGVKWMMAGGSAERVSDAKSQISAAILGIALLLTSFIILQTINPRLISLELPKLTPITSPTTTTETEDKIAMTAEDCLNQCRKDFMGFNYNEDTKECNCYDTDASCEQECAPMSFEYQTTSKQCYCIGCCLYERRGVFADNPTRCVVSNQSENDCHDKNPYPYPFVMYEYQATFWGENCPQNVETCGFGAWQ